MWSFSRAHGTLVQATDHSWLIFQLTNSPFYLGLEGLCLGLPRVVFSPLGGAIVDRANRKILFVVTQTAFLLMTLFLGVMDYLGTIRVSIFRRWLSDHFFCSVATLLQIQSAETNRGRRMSLFGLINCGPGPMGSFPFGLVAAAIGVRP